MEGDPGIGPDALLAGAESPEVLGRAGHHVGEELNYHPPLHLPADGNVQEAPRIRRLPLLGLHLPLHRNPKQRETPTTAPPLAGAFRSLPRSRSTGLAPPELPLPTIYFESGQPGAGPHGSPPASLLLPFLLSHPQLHYCLSFNPP